MLLRLRNLLGFLVILLVSYIVAKLVAAAVQKVLEQVGLDATLHEPGANKYVEKVMSGAKPSRGIARVVFWPIFAFWRSSGSPSPRPCRPERVRHLRHPPP